ncbi:MAG TPA: ATP-binding protein [Candidatus Limnocylindria bacterium]|nr:ATP-binding protein [Candidatus Limnocylindria bacterium]
MRPCACREPHPLKRVVLTGGPGAGKTAVLELIRHGVCEHVAVLPESAGIVFGGGFPRTENASVRRAGQRAIFFVQRELEAAAESTNPAIVLCDRGTVDGAAYWPGPDTLWSSVGVVRLDELARYDAVIHLRTPSASQGYRPANPMRIESAEDARRIDERIALEWDGHPRVLVVEATDDFVVKAHLAIELVRAELPACCRRHPVRVARERTGSRIEPATSEARR